jgi:hypothetical protein
MALNTFALVGKDYAGIVDGYTYLYAKDGLLILVDTLLHPL